MTYLEDQGAHAAAAHVEAADAYAQAARLLPSPHLLRQWGAAEMSAGRLDRSRAVWLRMLAKNPLDDLAWGQLLEVETRLGDRAGMQAAADSLLKVAPGDPRARQILEMLAATAPQAAEVRAP
jgi:tetratricopeptide (TPR) repeat protein